MWTLFFISIESFTIVTSHTLRDQDFWPFDRAPLTGFLAKSARLTLAPSFNSKDC